MQIMHQKWYVGLKNEKLLLKTGNGYKNCVNYEVLEKENHEKDW